jgi:plastocyanin
MIGMVTPNIFAEISYPSNYQRLQELPTYCIIDPVNFYASERMQYTALAQRGIMEWDRALQYSGVGGKFSSDDMTVAEAQEKWKINSKIISSYNSQDDCTIVLSFHETVGTESHPNAVGWFIPASQSITIAVKNLSEEKINNIILHEIGHSFGLGHYTSDNPETNDAWSSGIMPSPSIMIPTLNNIPSLMYIEDVDVQKVISIYGSNGFTAFSPQTPQTPIPSPPIKPIIPIFPFDNIQIIDTEIILNKYESTYSKIIGQIKESAHNKGHQVYVTIIKPDDTFDTHKILVTKSGYFELPLIFDKYSPVGHYTVEASYMEHRDASMDFTFSADFKKIISAPKIEKEITPLPDNHIETITESGFSQDCVHAGCYTPTTLTVNVGDGIIMTNTDPTGVHTFTSGTVNGFTPSPDGTFDSSVLMSGDSFEWIPESAGEQPYYCMLHSWMVGIIIVESIDEPKVEMEITLEKMEKMLFQSRSNFEIFENENKLLKEILEKLPSNYYDDNGINEAWYTLKENQQNVDQLKSLINGADRELKAERYESAEKYFDSIEYKYGVIEKNIKSISSKIQIEETVGTTQKSWQSEVVSSEKLGFQTLKNSKYGFSLDYPREWSFEDNIPSDPVAVHSLYFLIPDSMSFEVGVWKQSDYELKTVGMDYLNYMMDWIKDQCDNSLAYANEECTNYRLESAEIIKINNMDAYQIKYSMMDSYGSLTKIITDFKSPDYAFTIYAIADTDKFYNYENDFNAAINSFNLKNEDRIKDQTPVPESQKIPLDKTAKGGGCLIATATYGSEMATEVQQLRELRDKSLLQTESGTQFMTTFNEFYYSFSPHIADYERENPVFKEMVKMTITPLISSLSILNYVDMDSESSVLGYGVSLIILNLGMYLGIPFGIVIGIKRLF